MKKIFLLASVAILFGTVAEVSAQEYRLDSESEGINISAFDGDSVANISVYEGDQQGVRIRIPGLQLLLSANNGDNGGRRIKKVPSNSGLQFGINSLRINGGNIGDGSLEQITDLRTSGSVQFDFCLADAYMPITRDNTLVMTASANFVWNDYEFRNFTIGAAEGGNGVVILPVPEGTKKSKLNTFSLKVPVELMLIAANDFYLAAGVYGDLVMGAHTKIKHPKVKDRDIPINPFQAGWSFRVGHDGWSVYCNWAFIDLFRTNGHQPGVRPITFGFSTNIFE